MKLDLKSVCLQSLALFLLGAAVSAPRAFAQTNVPPPSGAILDLSGQPINQGSTANPESVSFTAALANTDITFAFRDDNAYISFSDVTLTDSTTGSTTNLILNGDFSSGSGTTPADWGYVNTYGSSFGGSVGNSFSCGGGFNTCWYDGSIQAYDAIDQTVATTIGDSYLLSFQYSENGGYLDFSALSTNGGTGSDGNGVDILAYAQSGPPPAGTVTPEPGSIWLMSTGALLLGAFFYSRRRHGMGEIA